MVPRTEERPNTIGIQWYDSKYEEYRATEDNIYPGMALELTTEEENIDQLPPVVKKMATADYGGPLRIATECRLGHPGDPASARGMSISDPYMDGDLITAIMPRVGDYFMARVAETANFNIGDFLKPHTDGTFVTAAAAAARVQVMEKFTHTASDEDAGGHAILPLLRVVVIR